MMDIIFAVVFSVCTWACFSKYVKDGIVIKHCLIFAALTSFIVVMEPQNTKAMSAVLTFLSIGGIWYIVREYQKILKMVKVHGNRAPAKSREAN